LDYCTKKVLTPAGQLKIKRGSFIPIRPQDMKLVVEIHPLQIYDQGSSLCRSSDRPGPVPVTLACTVFSAHLMPCMLLGRGVGMLLCTVLQCLVDGSSKAVETCRTKGRNRGLRTRRDLESHHLATFASFPWRIAREILRQELAWFMLNLRLLCHLLLNVLAMSAETKLMNAKP